MDKIIENYIEVCSALDGKKYSENITYVGMNFLDRHKKQCRTLVSSYTNPYGYIHKNYCYNTFETKENGIIKTICRGCGYFRTGSNYHFEEDCKNVIHN